MAALEHLALGMMAKPLAPKANVFILMLAAEVIDLLIIPFYLMKLDNFSLTHGLFMSVVWSVVFGLLAYWYYRDRRTSLVIAILVLSHWIIDFITHPMTFLFPDKLTPDMPLLFQNSLNVGLGMYQTLTGVIIGNLLLWGLGIAFYMRYRIKVKRALSY